MAVPVYMLSVLQQQALVLGSGFARAFPDSWLVWERGPRRWARARPVSDDEVARRPAPAPPTAPAGEDAMCFQLRLEPGQPELVVGRAAGNHVLVNDPVDATESCSLQQRGGRWYLGAVQGEARLNQRPLDLAAGAPLENGDVLSFGEVRLTYHDGPSFQARLLAPGVTPLPARPPHPRPEPEV